MIIRRDSQGHSVIVTGGTRGMGWEIALALICRRRKCRRDGPQPDRCGKITAARSSRSRTPDSSTGSLPMFASWTTACAWRMRQLSGLAASLD